MKDILKFIKKHSHIIVGVIIVIFVIILGVMIKNFFFPDDSKVYYGSRLDGIEKVKLTDKKKDELKEKFNNISKSITVRLQGRIIYIDVKLNDDVAVSTAKESADRTIEKLSEEERAYYDIQFIMGNDADTDHFPIIGYKHHTKPLISWNKDR